MNSQLKEVFCPPINGEHKNHRIEVNTSEDAQYVNIAIRSALRDGKKVTVLIEEPKLAINHDFDPEEIP